MCRLRSGEPSSHHAASLAERPLDLIHGFVRGAFSLPVGAPSWRRVPPAGPPSAGRRDRLARPHRDRGSPCATACRGRQSSDRPASPGASRYARPTSAAAWPPASSPRPPSPVSCRRSASAFPSDRWRPCVGFLAGFDPFGRLAPPPMLLRSASIRSTTFSPSRTLLRRDRFAGALWLMRSMSAVSYWSSNLSGSKRPAF